MSATRSSCTANHAGSSHNAGNVSHLSDDWPRSGILESCTVLRGDIGCVLRLVISVQLQTYYHSGAFVSERATAADVDVHKYNLGGTSLMFNLL